MKGIVVEIDGGYSAVLRDDGVVEKVKKRGEVGSIVELPDSVASKLVSLPRATKTVAAAAVAGVIVLSGSLYSYTTVQAYSYVTLDVNPSIEYSLNRRDRVTGVTALNDDSASIVEALMNDHVRGKTLTEAIEITTELLTEAGYLTDESEELLISVTSPDSVRQEKLAAEAEASLEHGKKKELSLDVRMTTTEERETAKELGISTGKYVKSLDPVEKEVETTKGETPATENATPSSPNTTTAPATPTAPSTEAPASNSAPAQNGQNKNEAPAQNSSGNTTAPGGGNATPPATESKPSQPDAGSQMPSAPAGNEMPSQPVAPPQNTEALPQQPIEQPPAQTMPEAPMPEQNMPVMPPSEQMPSMPSDTGISPQPPAEQGQGAPSAPPQAMAPSSPQNNGMQGMMKEAGRGR